jgi:hypothetical protein
MPYNAVDISRLPDNTLLSVEETKSVIQQCFDRYSVINCMIGLGERSVLTIQNMFHLLDSHVSMNVDVVTEHGYEWSFDLSYDNGMYKCRTVPDSSDYS